MKKSSYENGIAGAGYSGEIIVTPKRGRPYKGQPNSLPLVSKRQKIKKDDWYKPSNSNGAAQAARAMATGQIDTLPRRYKSSAENVPSDSTRRYLDLVDRLNPIPAAVSSITMNPAFGFAMKNIPQSWKDGWADFANKPHSQYLGAALGSAIASEQLKRKGLKLADPKTLPMGQTLNTLEGVIDKKTMERLPWMFGVAGVPAIAYLERILNAPQEVYGFASSAQNAKDAVLKEAEYYLSGQPNFAPVQTTVTNAPVKRFDTFGRTTTLPGNYAYKTNSL
jgi:hypothetical protein